MESADLIARINARTAEIEAADVSGRLDVERRKALAAKLDAVAAEAEREIYPIAHVSKDPALRDAAARLYRQLAMINSWLEGRDGLSRAWIDQAAGLASTDVLRDMLVREQNQLRDSEAFEGIRALCQKGLIDKARRELVRRRRAAKDPVLRKRLEDFLADPRNLLGPLGTAPGMYTLNGFGTMMWGQRNRRPDGTHVATLCLVFCFLPILPLRSYLVVREGSYWRFFGRVPLSPFAFWYRRLAILVPLLFGLVVWAEESYRSMPFIVENELLSNAERQVQRHDYAGALFTLAKMAKSSDAGRLQKLDRLAQQALLEALNGIQTAEEARAFAPGFGGPAARLQRPLGKEVEAAAEAALRRIAPHSDSGAPARDLLTWMAQVFPDVKARERALALEIAAVCHDPAFLAYVVGLFKTEPCPVELVSRLGSGLQKKDYAGWAGDSMTYLLVADAAEARPVLLKRVEPAWKGATAGGELLALKILPELLRTLIQLDLEPVVEKRVEGTEKLAKADGLRDPEKDWHRLGVARRLVKLLSGLHEKDPVNYPLSRLGAWALLAAELDPGNADARNQALRFLLEDGDFARAIRLGTPEIKDPKTALLVGIAHSRAGELDKAAGLLRPLVDRNLASYVNSVLLWEKAVDSKSHSSWESLRKGTANQTLISRLNALPKEQASAEAEKWVRLTVNSDPYVLKLLKTWKDLDDTRDAAAELAMIDLSAGQSLPPGPERTTKLQSAEHCFLELRKIGANNPRQELHLGQVYFWLGKEKEALEVLTALEKDANFQILHSMGEMYRGLSRFADARRVLELAYDKGTPAEKFGVALTRSLASSSREDRVAWLKKGDPNNLRIKMEIEQITAEEDLRAGRFATAISGLQHVAAYYAGLPENSTTLNNAALIQDHLAIATGDLKHILEAARLLRKAHELEPEGAIVLVNYLVDLEAVGYAALAGTVLRADLLHEYPGWEWMEFASPLPSPEEWAARVKNQAELRRTAELGVRAAVLAPESRSGVDAQAAYYSLTRDGAAMRKLRETVAERRSKREVQTDAPTSPKTVDDAANNLKELEKGIFREKATVDLCRKMGHAPSLAFALLRLSNLRYSSSGLPKSDQTMELAIKDADAAVAAFNAYPTRQRRATLGMTQAALAFASSEPDFATWVKDDTSDPATLLVLYAMKNPGRLETIRKHPSVARTAEEIPAVLKLGGERSWVHGWAWLDLAGHANRDEARRVIVASPTLLDAYHLEVLLEPESAPAVVTAWLAATAAGDKERAEELAAHARKHELLPRFFKP